MIKTGRLRLGLILISLCVVGIFAKSVIGEKGRFNTSLNGKWGFEPIFLNEQSAIDKGIEFLRKKYPHETIESYLTKIISAKIEIRSLPNPAQNNFAIAHDIYKNSLADQFKALSANPPILFNETVFVPSFWTYTKDFGYPEKWKSAHAAWYGKSFFVPGNIGDQIIKLRFDAVNCKAKVFVNGKYAGHHIGGFTPFEIDITDYVKLDSNNILNVFVQDGSSVLSQNGKYTAPVGELLNHPGIWQTVSLRSYPRVHVQDVVIKTSVRRQTIRVEASIKNQLDCVVSGSLKADIGQGVALGEEGFRIQPKSESTVVFEKKWDTPALWSPENPHLYNLTVKLSVPASKQPPITDQISQPFGFREFWVEGTDFFLNGRRIRLRGDSINRIPSAYVLTPEYVRAFFEAAKEAHINVVRLHTAVFPEFVLDIADEMGMLIIDEAPIMGWTPYDFSDLTHFRQFFREWVKRDRNHPSVIIWSALNECLYYKKHIVPFKEMISIGDDTRPVKFEGNGDAYGVADIFDVHYPGEHDLPELLLALLEEQGDGNLDGFRYHDQIWSGDKPIAAGEFGPIFYVSPGRIAFLRGEGVYEGIFSGRKNYDAAVGDFAAIQIKAMRSLQFGHIAPWTTLNSALQWLQVDVPFHRAKSPDENIPGMQPERIVGHYSFTLNPGFLPREPQFKKTILYDKIRDALTPLALFTSKPNRNLFEDKDLGEAWVLHNDTPNEICGNLVWEVSYRGRIIDRKGAELTLPSGHSIRGRVDTRSPKVGKKETIRVDIRATDEKGECLLNRSYAHTVYPKKLLTDPVGSLSGMKIGLYDKTGRISKILEGLGVKAFDVRSPVASGLDLLIIGKDSLDMAMADGARAYARGGGKVLVFEQASPLGFDHLTDGMLGLEEMKTPIAFPLAEGNAVFENIGYDDIRFWGEDYLVSRLNFVKPDCGVFRLLAEAGGNDGLRHTPLLEVREGKGILILSQLLLVEKFFDEPAAAILLRNILEYAAELQTDRLPENLLLIIRDRENRPFTDFVEAISIPFEISASSDSGELAPHGAVLMDAESVNWSAVKKNKQRFLDHLERGGSLIVQGLAPSTAASFNDVFETDVSISPTSLHHPQVEKEVVNEALWGLSNDDLVWTRNPVQFVAYGSKEWALIREPAKTATFPQEMCWGDALRFTQSTAKRIANPGAALLKIPYGAGNIFINQMLPLADEPKSKRYFSTVIASELLR